MERTQFTFYESFYRACARIKSSQARAQAYDAICAYALYGEEPDMEELPDVAALAFELIKPNLDASRRKAISGKAGGAASKTEANVKQTESKTEANDKQTESEKENKKEKENKIEIENKCYKKTRARFSPPTLEEVQAYVLERKSPVDPQAFIDFYAAKGWLVGKSPMKDWKAACRNAEKWERWASNATGNAVRASANYTPPADVVKAFNKAVKEMDI